MKILSSILFMVLAGATSAQAEVKPAGTVMASACGVSFDPVMSYNTVSEFCTAKIVGDAKDYVLVKFENSTNTKAYVVTGKKQSKQGYLVQFSFIGFIENQRIHRVMPIRAETGKAFIFTYKQTYAVKGIVDGSNITVRSLNAVFHTMSVPETRSLSVSRTSLIPMVAFQCLRDDDADDWVINIQLSTIPALNKAQLFDNDSWADYKLVRNNKLQYVYVEENGASQITFTVAQDQKAAKAIYSSKGFVGHKIKFSCKRSDLGVQY